MVLKYCFEGQKKNRTCIEISHGEIRKDGIQEKICLTHRSTLKLLLLGVKYGNNDIWCLAEKKQIKMKYERKSMTFEKKYLKDLLFYLLLLQIKTSVEKYRIKYLLISV